MSLVKIWVTISQMWNLISNWQVLSIAATQEMQVEILLVSVKHEDTLKGTVAAFFEICKS